MGFERGPRKPPEFVIKAAMNEDPHLLRKLASAGGKASAAKKAEAKRVAAEQEAAKLRTEAQEQARLEEEREILDLETQKIIARDAFAHNKAVPPSKDD